MFDHTTRQSIETDAHALLKRTMDNKLTEVHNAASSMQSNIQSINHREPGVGHI